MFSAEKVDWGLGYMASDEGAETAKRAELAKEITESCWVCLLAQARKREITRRSRELRLSGLPTMNAASIEGQMTKQRYGSAWASAAG